MESDFHLMCQFLAWNPTPLSRRVVVIKTTARKAKDGSDEVITMERYALNGSGHQLSCYRPAKAELKAELVKWMNKPMV